FLKIVQILGQRGPLDLKLQIALCFTPALLRLVVERTHRAFAEYLRGNTLPQFTQRAVVDNPRRFRVRQHVDETWSHCQPVGINDCRSSSATQISDRRDPITLDPDV